MRPDFPFIFGLRMQTMNEKKGGIIVMCHILIF